MAEGGGIRIVREKNEISVKFIYYHNEFDPTEEGLSVNKNGEYDNFEQPFQLINDRYSQHMLHLETVHEDYRNYIIDRLIEKLNTKSVEPNYLANKKVEIEYILKIKLNCNSIQRSNSFVWSCEKIK